MGNRFAGGVEKKLFPFVIGCNPTYGAVLRLQVWRKEKGGKCEEDKQDAGTTRRYHKTHLNSDILAETGWHRLGGAEYRAQSSMK